MKPLATALLLLAGTACSAPGPDAAPAPSAPAVPARAEVAAATSEQPDAPPRTDESHTVVQATEGTTALTVGQVLEIALEGNAGTGYAWELESDGAPQLRREPAPPALETTQADGPRMVGGSATQRWHFRAEQAGAATVKLVYRRPWEVGVPAAREAVFGVVVGEAAAP